MFRNKSNTKQTSTFTCLAFVFIVHLLLLSGCGKTNVHSADQSVICSNQHIFNASYDRTTKAVAAAISIRNSIKVYDNDSGIISSHPALVDGEELSILDTIFLGQTYKYSYKVVVTPISSSKSRVKIQVTLMLDQYWSVINREQKLKSLEEYLRKKLYTVICNKLFPKKVESCLKSLPCSQNRKLNRSANLSSSVNPNFNADVKLAQTKLLRKGYLPGLADGIMGRKTRNAIKEYQRDNDLQVTGRIEGITKKLLLAKKAASRNKQQQANESSAILESKKEKTVVKDKKLAIIKEGTAHTILYGVINETTIFMPKASSFSTPIGNVEQGTKITILATKNGFLKIRMDNKDGYVYADFVDIQE